MCDCIKRLENMLTQKMVEKYPNGEVIASVEFENKILIVGEGKTNKTLYNPAIGRVRTGKSIRKFETTIYPKFCPYCGQPTETK